MPKVSVIIPVYNVEQYLEKCLDSVVNQTYKDLEIICVNDCSPDNCAEILNKYAEQDDRIILVNRKENGGLSAARNSGLDVATGEYVYFIDSDDWIDLDYIEKMVEAIEKVKIDIIVNTNIIKEYSDRSEFFVWNNYIKKLHGGEHLDSISAINNSQCMIWCHLYKREFLSKNNLRFPEGYIHEDAYFQHISKFNVDSIFVFYGSAYHYLQRNNSIMSSRKNKIEAFVKIYRLIYDYYKQHNLLTKNNRIKLYPLTGLVEIKNEQDLLLAKSYLDYIAVDFEKERMASSDYEKFIFNVLKKAQSYDECKWIAEKNCYVTYVIREKLRRKKNIKISVIIPVYNVEQYLEKCLDSVCGQTLEDIEIICINDCSTDNSLEVLKRYEKEDNRIKIINFSENKGAAAARNAGIATAAGEYIGFVDSDDWIDLDFYEKLYTKAKETNADGVKGNCKITKTGCIDYSFNNKIKENKTNFIYEFWSAIFKKRIIDENSLTFPILVNFEDPVFAFRFAILANKIEIIDTNLNKNWHENSQSRSFPSIKKIKDVFYGLNLLIDIANNAEIRVDSYCYVLGFCIFDIFHYAIKNDNCEIRDFIAKSILELFAKTKHNGSLLIEIKNRDELLSKYIQRNDFNSLKNFVLCSRKDLIFAKLRKNITQHSLVSVIIPVYNVEQYLEKCLESVVNQTYKDLEIICVNDCSPDNCAEILNKYAEQDDRIILVNRKENGGLSAARNSGLDIATGEYVYFIDSDDWIDLDYIEKMVGTIENADVDIVYNANMIKEEEDKNSYERVPVCKYNSYYENNDAIEKTLWSVCSHLYKRKLLVNNKIKFPEGYIHEDVFFQHVVKYYAKKIYVFWGSSYHYFKRKGSITRRKANIAANHVKILKLLNEFYKQFCSIDNLEIKLFKGYMFSQINDEEEFKHVKEYVLSLKSYLKNKYYLFSDYEQYVIKGIINSDNGAAFIKDFGKNSYLTYITREKLKRQKNIKVSVIIPVYNVEQYLEKCLNSVVNQTLKDIEIICINDCSTDNSLEILKEYAAKDNRIKIVNHEKNSGRSAARNSGLNVAAGEYIYYIDSDDWIDLDYLEKMVCAAETSHADVVFNCNIDTEGYVVSTYSCDSLKESFNTFIDAQKVILSIPWNIWAYIWKKAFLDRINVNFPVGYLCEDVYYHAVTLAYLDKLYVINGSAYHYYIQQYRLTGKYKNNNALNRLKILNLICDRYKERNLFEIVDSRLFYDGYHLFMDCYDEGDSMINRLRKYFNKIKFSIERNKSMYSQCELTIVEDVINNNIPSSLKKYENLYLIEQIHLKKKKL